MIKPLALTSVTSEDYRFIEKNENFNPKRNQAIIQEVIEDGYKLQKVMRDSYRKDTETRIDILSTYARHSLNGGEKTLEQFMGREWMAKIYGEKILEKLRIADSVRRLNKASGNTRFGEFYLT